MATRRQRIPDSFEITRGGYSRIPIVASRTSASPITANGRTLPEAMVAIREQLNTRLRELSEAVTRGDAEVARQTTDRLYELSVSLESVSASVEAALEVVRAAVNAIEDSKRFFQKSLQVAYYGGASGTQAVIDEDLAALSGSGWGGVRVWASWFWSSLSQDEWSPLMSDGSINTVRMDRLRYLMGRAFELDMFVDLTLSRGKLQTMEAQRTGIKNLVDSVGDFSGVILDVVNEWNGVQEASQVAELAKYAKELAPSWKITASTQGPVGDQVSAYLSLFNAGGVVDQFTPHFLRTADWSEATGARIAEFRNGIRERGGAAKLRSIYLQEEALREDTVDGPLSGEAVSYKAFVTAAIQAKRAGAISWGFMNRRGFDLRNGSMYSQADEVELEVLANLPAEVQGA